MTARTLLSQRASVKRAVTQYVDGSPHMVWVTAFDTVMCLVSFDSFGSDEEQVRTDKAPRKATLFVGPEDQLQPGDVVTMKGRSSGRYKVGAQGQAIPDRFGLKHHSEWAVEETS